MEAELEMVDKHKHWYIVSGTWSTNKAPSIDPSISSALWTDAEILEIWNSMKYCKTFDLSKFYCLMFIALRLLSCFNLLSNLNIINLIIESWIMHRQRLIEITQGI